MSKKGTPFFADALVRSRTSDCWPAAALLVLGVAFALWHLTTFPDLTNTGRTETDFRVASLETYIETGRLPGNIGPLPLVFGGGLAELGLSARQAGRWVSALFAMPVFLLAFGLLRQVTGRWPAVAGALGLLGYPLFFRLATVNVAEGPFFTVLLAATLLAARLWRRRSSSPAGWLAVAGLFVVAGGFRFEAVAFWAALSATVLLLGGRGLRRGGLILCCGGFAMFALAALALPRAEAFPGIFGGALWRNLAEVDLARWWAAARGLPRPFFLAGVIGLALLWWKDEGRPQAVSATTAVALSLAYLAGHLVPDDAKYFFVAGAWLAVTWPVALAALAPRGCALRSPRPCGPGGVALTTPERRTP
jgi:Dolichyl-phosphate-mannose-protein mannosyltransferase